MELIRKGFDRLEVSFKAKLPKRLFPRMEQAKQIAATTGVPSLISINGKQFHIAGSGMLGGYAYRAHTGKYGAEWWFKKDGSEKDKWGIRVRVSSILIAIRGWRHVRGQIEQTLETFGLSIQPYDVSVARVDFAMDFLYPEFEPVSDNFIMGHRFKRNQNAVATEYREAGRSNRIETITIGKNPGRQLQIYDKRAEVIAKSDRVWFEVFNKERQAQGKPPLDFNDAASSRIWRLELRAFKKHLKDDWKVATWHGVENTLPRIFSAMLRDIRYTIPSPTDQNRSRWKTHPLWEAAHGALKDGLLDLQAEITMERVKEIELNEWESMIRSQVAGSIIALGARRSIDDADFNNFAKNVFAGLVDAYQEEPRRTAVKLAKARRKYGQLNSEGMPNHDQ